MELKKATDCDVLVLGSGIAGISAALRAAELGARVILACKGPLFSGSSFYPGTWGLGLIGPENEADKKDLAETILMVREAHPYEEPVINVIPLANTRYGATR